MKDYIFNTTNEKIDTSEMDKVINFACKKMDVINPLLNIMKNFGMFLFPN